MIDYHDYPRSSASRQRKDPGPGRRATPEIRGTRAEAAGPLFLFVLLFSALVPSLLSEVDPLVLARLAQAAALPSAGGPAISKEGPLGPVESDMALGLGFQTADGASVPLSAPAGAPRAIRVGDVGTRAAAPVRFQCGAGPRAPPA